MAAGTAGTAGAEIQWVAGTSHWRIARSLVEESQSAEAAFASVEIVVAAPFAD